MKKPTHSVIANLATLVMLLDDQIAVLQATLYQLPPSQTPEVAEYIGILLYARESLDPLLESLEQSLPEAATPLEHVAQDLMEKIKEAFGTEIPYELSLRLLPDETLH